MTSIQQHFFIFGLSGAGKTTFVNEVCKTPGFAAPTFTMTRAPRPDDDPSAIEYVTVEIFKQYREENAFYIDDDDGVNFYGFRRANLQTSPGLLLYGLPTKIDEIKQIGAKCILIQAPASMGLSIRNDEPSLREKREHSNEILFERYYGNPIFVKKMDLNLIHQFEGLEKLVTIFKRFTLLTLHESRALQGDVESLKIVLRVHWHPLEGITSHFHFWVKEAMKNEELMNNFYSRILTARRL